MIRHRLLSMCGRLRLSDALLRVQRLVPPAWLTVLAYHRVCEPEDAGPWDPDVVSATPDQFRRQLAFLKRHFTPILSEDVVRWAHDGGGLPRSPAVITFDDGYLDNFTVALPLLEEAGLRADFFVCPGNIEERRLFWWDKIAFCIGKSRRPSVTLTHPARMELDLSSTEAVEASRHALLRATKVNADTDIGRTVQELQEATGVQPDEAGEARKLLMGWYQIRALRQAGMGVGSHSYSHPILPHGSEGAVREELVRSKHDIEAVLGEPVFALAYPTGRFDNGTKTLAREAGYELAYSYCSGASFLRHIDVYEIRRVAVERYMSLPHFRAMVAVPFLS